MRKRLQEDRREPIRDEVLGPDRLIELAERIGRDTRLAAHRRRRPRLLGRLTRNRARLRRVRDDLHAALLAGEAISPAAEWLVDNFHLLEEQFIEVIVGLPRGYYRSLPKLADDDTHSGRTEAGMPRVVALATSYVAHTDSRFDPALFRSFIMAVQRASVLEIGELWAAAISLRVVLLENLRRLADSIVERRAARQAADAVADRVLGLPSDSPLPRAAAEALLLQAADKHSDSAFLVQLFQRLREEDAGSNAGLDWLLRELLARGAAPDALVEAEHQLQAANQVTVANAVTSLRNIAKLDWPKWVESVSIPDEILRRDAAGVYQAQDFASRDQMRHALEALARGSRQLETDVAQAAIRNGARYLAERAKQGGGGPPDTDPTAPIAGAHVGYWLLGGGRRDLERELGYRAGVRETVERMVRAAGLWGYLGAAAALAVVPAVALAWLLWTRGSPLGLAVGLALLALFPLGDAAFALVNRAVLRVVPPRSLPKLEFDEGIPAVHATVVAVPTLLINEEEIAEQIDRLEVHYLANSEAQVWYLLASDFADADHETEPGDAALLASASEAIARLNARHGGGSIEQAAATPPRFLLLHRRRLWNPGQGKWMGWERKRGKLEELNRWLAGDASTTFLTPPQPWLRGVRFVVTLDADTRLPRGALRKMVGCLAHPLHRPRIDPATRTVTSGYGILQPRVVPMLPERGRGSLYQRIFSGPTGVDPYVAAVSDVYQDLFEEGSYTGKGIYDVAAFSEALRGRTPENALLSHDLFEGSFARAGLATDILVFEEFPANYAVAAARQHRWTRGDWQLLPWLLSSRVPGVSSDRAAAGTPGQRAAARVPNPLSALSRWKMLDNLRRSLSPIASLLLLAGGWLAAPVEPAWWLAVIAALLALPPSLSVLGSFLPRRHAAAERADPGELVAEAGIAGAQAVLALALLPARAHLRADAIVRTLWRLAARRRLLEWVTAAQARAGATLGWGGFFARMASSPVCAAALVASCQMFRPERMPVVLPVALLWLLAPAIARALSVPRLQQQELPLAAADARYLRLLARRTWRYFEDFAGAPHLYLPADNFQDDPVPAVAARTSPTNIGLGLLASVIAHDFGWISGAGLADRLEGAFDTMERLERFHGHFLNWYGLDNGRSLEPRYVSTVDSGNLAAALLAVAAACREAARSEAPPASKAAAGEADALMLARAAAAAQDLDEERRWFEAAARTAESWHRELMLAGDTEGWQRQSRQFATLARRAESFAAAMDFRVLYDANRELLSTGMRLPDGQLDESHYDLLASEARLASFLAIAKGDAPLRHWFHLGRPVAGVAGDAGLLSWSGSMFEYLMPALLMREPAGSLLERTNRSAVAAHRLFGRRHRIPWGVSESAFNVRDRELIYQYGPFGVPELALKRAVIGEVVVAPYATALAAMVDPAAAIANLRRLEELGALGRYGFREALDFSPARVPAGRSFAMINSWMAHHQGMSLAAFANVLLAGLPRDRFHASAAARSTELLLQERTPRDILTVGPRPAPAPPLRVRATAPTAIRRYSSPHQRTPRVQLLSNGAYSVMMTAAGGGWSRRSGMAVTRWREDATRDCWGSFLYLRDPWTGELWSAGYQPLAKEAAEYEVLLADAKVEIRRRDGTIESRLEVVVSAEDDAELRLLTLLNHGPRERKIEVTSYAEVALVPPAADEAHPAYSNLFVRTEYVHSPSALLAHRRPHGGAEEQVWAAHVLAVAGARDGAMQHETDRARFLGRGRGPERAQVLDGRPLSGTTGPVLDPIFSWRQAVRIPANGKAQLLFTTLVGADRETVMRLAEKYQALQSYERAAALAWTRAQVELRHVGITADEAHLYQRLASGLVYSDPSLRPPPETLRRSHLGQPGLWALGISGDLPIVLLRVEREDDRTLLRQVLRAQSYLRSRGLGADVVVLNEHPSTYSEEVQSALMAVAAAAGAEAPEKGRVFLLRADQISPDTRDLLMAAARIVLVARRGTLAEQLQRVAATVSAPPNAAPRAARLPSPPSPPLSPAPQFWNGLGGFVDGGRVYSIALDTAPQTTQQTPVPWINVIANEQFGFQVSESGAGFTWAINSRENKLTPWSNDPVADPAGEVFYVRDADSGALLSPTASPAVAAEGGPFRCRHGQGWSEFEHAADGLELRLTQLVPFSDPVKISRLVVRNASARPRRLEAYFFADLVLGVTRSATAPHLVTHLDASTGALFAENRWNPEFAERTALVWISGEVVAHTADRGEFLGRHGSVERPAALRGGGPLSGRTGAGLDPCAALSSAHNLAPGASVEILVLLGQGDDREHARALVERYREIDYEAQLAAVKERWEGILGALQVESPDPALDLLVNRWLLYQTLSCRLWARSGFYQSSGAYGFRDQLQDAMALSVAHRETPRAQILRAAARQFREGDVQHWWHIPSGRGVRTRCSDDLLWLPLAAIRYAEATGDWTVFGEPVSFLEQPLLGAGVQEEYRQPELSAERATLYEHCARAVDYSVAVGVGAHGLPLIGSGDWNDGMNRVGIGGRGESVWLGWFQCVVLEQMAGLADARHEPERAVRWRMRRQEVAAALEKTAWDGAWYRRAFYDDGTPLGSAANRECRIDSIAQSWAVLSGVGDRNRATRAMAAVQEHLVRRGDGLVLLFTPPFEHTAHDPGYIKSYLPGVRENGGQYTHAAIWTVIAYAELGDGDRAGELFSLLNPINHTSNRAGVYRYQGEPYVTAGDIYSEVPHLGRAGWTWYTGSAGWMYRAAVEWILGFRLRGDHLHVDPCIPRHWPRYAITFRYHGGSYRIEVDNPRSVARGVVALELDGAALDPAAGVPLSGLPGEHLVRVRLGTEPPASAGAPAPSTSAGAVR